MGPTCYMSSTRNSLTLGRKASWLSSPLPIWESDLILEAVIMTRKLTFMVLGEGIRPLQGRWAEKGLKGPGTLRPHNCQASCSHTASLCSSVCGSSGV